MSFAKRAEVMEIVWLDVTIWLLKNGISYKPINPLNKAIHLDFGFDKLDFSMETRIRKHLSSQLLQTNRIVDKDRPTMVG